MTDLFSAAVADEHVCTKACSPDFHPVSAPVTPRGRAGAASMHCVECGRAWPLHNGDECPIDRYGYAPGLQGAA